MKAVCVGALMRNKKSIIFFLCLINKCFLRWVDKKEKGISIHGGCVGWASQCESYNVFIVCELWTLIYGFLYMVEVAPLVNWYFVNSLN